MRLRFSAPFSAVFFALLFALLLALFSVLSCSADIPPAGENKPAGVRNIILLIGDGMGPAQFGLLESYARRAPNSIYQGRPTAVSQLMQQGKVLLSDTGPHDVLVTDSACSATQLAIGEASGSEMIGLNARGDRVETILQKAKRAGMRTGLVSDTRITHATPAAFAAHQPHRRFENEIAADLLTTAPDLMLSGGLRYFLPQDAANISTELQKKISAAQLTLKSKRTDQRNLLSEAQQQGYALAFNRQQLAQQQYLPLLGLFASSAMNDAIYARQNPASAQPDLNELTRKALQLLGTSERGFFLMVEGGQIDWAAHNNDAGALLHELLRFDAAIQEVVNWAADRDDTLVVLTADHETGGFGFSYSAHDVPAARTLPGNGMRGQAFAPNYNFAPLSLLDRLYAQKKGYYRLWGDASTDASSDGNKGLPTADSLMAEVNAALDFPFSRTQAERVLRRDPNPYFDPQTDAPAAATQPHIEDFSDFYVYREERYLNALARELASAQSVVWSTGTHTAAPVPVVISGPEPILQNFQGFTRHAELGHQLKALIKTD